MFLPGTRITSQFCSTPVSPGLLPLDITGCVCFDTCRVHFDSAMVFDSPTPTWWLNFTEMSVREADDKTYLFKSWYGI